MEQINYLHTQTRFFWSFSNRFLVNFKGDIFDNHEKMVEFHNGAKMILDTIGSPISGMNGNHYNKKHE